MDRNLLEVERVRLGYTQKAWAALLGMSLSSYKRLISYESDKINVDLPEKFYKLTGKPLFSSPLTDTIINLRRLSPAQRKFISDIINFELNFDEEGKYVGKDSTIDRENSLLREIHRLFNR